MLGNSVAVVRTRPRAIPLAMITMRQFIDGFPFFSNGYGAPLGGPWGRRSFAINDMISMITMMSRKMMTKSLDLCRRFE